MSAYLIAGIGTGVGKTLVTAALAYQLRQAGRAVQALKPVISGYGGVKDALSDTAQLVAACGLESSVANHIAISPWRFSAPLSPHLAAAAEGKPLLPEEVIAWCRLRAEADATTLIEGIGGVMVPLTSDYLQLTMMVALGYPVILVAGSYLGAINHTLLTVKALLDAGLTVQGLVVSEQKGDEVGLQATTESIAPFLPSATPIRMLPYLPEAEQPWKNAPDLLSLVA